MKEENIEWIKKLKKELLNSDTVQKQFNTVVTQRFYNELQDIFEKSYTHDPKSFIEEIRHIIDEYDDCIRLWYNNG